MKKSRKTLFGMVSAAFLAGTLLTACGTPASNNSSTAAPASAPAAPAPAETGGTLKIGAVLPMTGASAVFGEKFQQAYSLAIEEINAAGGVNGKKLEIVIEDSQEKPQVGKTATEKLVADKEIIILTGGRSSGVTLVEAQVANENKVPYLIDHGSSDKATMSGYDYVFRLNPTAGMYTSALRDYFKANPPKSIAYINVDNAFGEAVYEYGIKKYIEESKVPFTLEKYKAGELDFKPIMEKVKATNPEVVIVTAGDDNDATQIMKAAKESGVSPKMFVGTGAGHSIIGFAKQAGALAETVLTAGPWHGNKKDPKYQEFHKKFTEKFQHEPGEHEVEGYAAIYVIADVFKRAKSLDREGVKEALETTDMDTVFGHVKFEDFDGYKNQNRGMTDISQWIGGKMITVYPDEYAQDKMKEFQGWK
ncbi:ABC transporter substrate-binding protein [Brevibacillus agri]|uniref:ABC transporter substrate-binding protein n=1 Tax=Brevibacillus agri TaxID=51101 RepID=UPI003D1900E3